MPFKVFFSILIEATCKEINMLPIGSTFFPLIVAPFKEAKSVTMNIFRKKKIPFKSFVKIGLSYVFTINMLSTSENCMEK